MPGAQHIIDPGFHHLAGSGQQDDFLVVSQAVVSGDAQQPDFPGALAAGGWVRLWITFTAITDIAASRMKAESSIIHRGFLLGGQQSPPWHPQSVF